jgi:hypothetical protein
MRTWLIDFGSAPVAKPASPTIDAADYTCKPFFALVSIVSKSSRSLWALRRDFSIMKKGQWLSDAIHPAIEENKIKILHSM